MLFLTGLDSGFLDVVLAILALLMALLVAIPFHEFAHAFVAKCEGDYTAVAHKRCTPAALAHFDLAGFFMMLVFGFGWAKPVPVDYRNFKHGRRSQFLVSIAGVVMNLVIGIIALFIYMLIYKIDSYFFVSTYYGYLLEMFLYYSYTLNFGLAFFNLLPIYPFDGYNVIDSMCRQENAYLRFARKYSTLILILILVTGLYYLVYGYVIGNLYRFLIDIFGKILGL